MNTGIGAVTSPKSKIQRALAGRPHVDSNHEVASSLGLDCVGQAIFIVYSGPAQRKPVLLRVSACTSDGDQCYGKLRKKAAQPGNEDCMEWRLNGVRK